MQCRILIPCPGLGLVNRGFESALSQCSETLRQSGLFDVMVLGGGAAPFVDAVIPMIKRSWFFPFKFFSKNHAYKLEQASFYFMASKTVSEFNPHVIYLSDILLARFFFRKRERDREKYKILFRNGAPTKPPFNFCDHVQQINNHHYESAVEFGEAPEKMTFLPSGFRLHNPLSLSISADLQSLRASLGLPKDRKILIAVGAIGKNHKRLDYIINEVSQLQPRPFLVILGERDGNAASIEALALRLLEGSFLFRTVMPEEVSSYLRAADLFVHGALSEGLCRAVIEAASEGKPCLLHDANVFRAMLVDYPFYSDFTQAGSLAALVKSCLDMPVDKVRLMSQQQFVYEHYSWQSLNQQFIKLIQDQAEMSQAGR